MSGLRRTSNVINVTPLSSSLLYPRGWWAVPEGKMVGEMGRVRVCFEANQRDIEMLDRIAEELEVDRDALLRATVVSIIADYFGKRELIRKALRRLWHELQS